MSVTLYDKLKEHFTTASQDYPVAKELFEEKLSDFKEAFLKAKESSTSKSFEDVLFLKGVSYKVSKLTLSSTEGKKIMGCFWESLCILRNHKGPKI